MKKQGECIRFTVAQHDSRSNQLLVWSQIGCTMTYEFSRILATISFALLKAAAVCQSDPESSFTIHQCILNHRQSLGNNSSVLHAEPAHLVCWCYGENDSLDELFTSHYCIDLYSLQICASTSHMSTFRPQTLYNTMIRPQIQIQIYKEALNGKGNALDDTISVYNSTFCHYVSRLEGFLRNALRAYNVFS